MEEGFQNLKHGRINDFIYVTFCVDFKKRASDLPKPAVVLIGEENNESPLAAGELKLNLSCNKKDTC
jgi:hypothetical protein